ncbi:MAG: hypothetical protein HPY69_08895 [Armatimonadetes bacterium]|nr:hypothetical protein [Armatimonadota bacterium]
MGLISLAALFFPGLMGQNNAVRLPVIADTSLQAYAEEVNCNSGAVANLRIKGNEHYLLLKFDLAAITGWQVRRARLYLHDSHPNMLRTLGLSTVAADWTEGTGDGGPAQDGCTFTRANWPDGLWAWPGSDFLDVALTGGNTIVRYADIQPGADGWFSVEVDPVLIHAMLSGASHGLCVSDEKGQTRHNNDVHSREQSSFAPYLEVEGGPAGELGPLPELGPVVAEPWPAGASFETGAVRLRLHSPGTFRYAIACRPVGEAELQLPLYQVPRPVEAGREQSVPVTGLRPDADYQITISGVDAFGRRTNSQAVSVRSSSVKRRPEPLPGITAVAPSGSEPVLAGGLRVWACPAECKVSPVTGNVLEEVGAEAYEGEPTGQYRRGNPVWDGGRALVRAARGELIALQVIVESETPTPRQVAVRLEANDSEAFPAPLGIYRNWYVRDGGQWYAEYLAPLGEGDTLSLPAEDNAVAGQRNQGLTLLWEVPLDATPGSRSASLRVTAGEPDATLTLPLELEILPLTIPPHTTFELDLNCYGEVQSVNDWAEYLQVERQYYAWAHRLRGTLNSLGYSHSGRMSRGYAPPVEGEGAAMRVADWSEWDEHFGPYLDGSAFTGVRAGIPVTHMYLPLHEAWPSPMAGHYSAGNDLRKYPDNIALHALTAPPIEQAFDEAYKEAFRTITRQFVEHFHDRGWNQTSMQCYQNNKYYYKSEESDFRGTSWWLLDEPSHRDDWLALAFFSRLFHEGLSYRSPLLPEQACFEYRGDISRPHLQRDWLDSLIDVMCVSGALFEHPEQCRAFRAQGVRLWHYGEANPVAASNLNGVAWALQAYCGGADGILPWQVIGGESAYTQPTPTALLIPGTRFGLTGPVVSLRLLALCRGQQDVEYLNLLCQQRGYDRDQIAALVAQTLGLTGRQVQASAEDAGNLRFDRLRPEDFAALRHAVAVALTEG